MSKKDYELIAAAIKSGKGLDQDTKNIIAENIAKALGGKNSKFNHGKFLDACGVKY